MSQILFTAVAVLGDPDAVRWQNPRWPRSCPKASTGRSRCRRSCSSAIHIVTSAIDPFTALGWESVLLPFAVDYKPLFLGLGSVATYLLVAITGDRACCGSGSGFAPGGSSTG